jgi:hypothetical protein
MRLAWTLLALATLAIAVPSATPNASAESCFEDSLDKVTRDGEILVMMSGAIFRVMAGDAIDSALWLPPSDVLICPKSINVGGRLAFYYEIINTDEGEKVTATKLR